MYRVSCKHTNKFLEVAKSICLLCRSVDDCGGNKIGQPYTVPCKVTGKCDWVTVKFIPASRGTCIVSAPIPKKLLQMAGIENCYTLKLTWRQICGRKFRWPRLLTKSLRIIWLKTIALSLGLLVQKLLNIWCWWWWWW